MSAPHCARASWFKFCRNSQSFDWNECECIDSGFQTKVLTENLNECKIIRGDWAAQKCRINLKYHSWSPLGLFPYPFPGVNQPYWCARQMLGPNKDFLGWCCAAGNCPIYASNKYTGSQTGTQGPKQVHRVPNRYTGSQTGTQGHKQVHRVTNSYAGSQCQTFSAWKGNLLIRKLMWLIWRLTDPAAEIFCWTTMAPCLFCRVLSFNPDPILLGNICFFSTRQSLKCQPSQMVWHNNNMPSLISLCQFAIRPSPNSWHKYLCLSRNSSFFVDQWPCAGSTRGLETRLCIYDSSLQVAALESNEARVAIGCQMENR